MTPLATAARREVEELHAVFVELFTHRSRDFGRCEAAFAADFAMVTPDGRKLDRSAILSGIRAARTKTDFAITIRDPMVIREGHDWVLLQYVEQQYRDGQTTRRLSSVLFTGDPTAPCGVVWRYLQETWIRTEQEFSPRGS